VRRSYKFRLRPTAKQHVTLAQYLSSHRSLYNAALQERRDAYNVVRMSADFFGPSGPKSTASHSNQSAQLSEIRGLCPEHATWSFSSQQATLRQLDKAFQAFFRRVKSGETPGYPRFKSSDRFNSVTWPSDGDGCRWKPDQSLVYLQGVGHVKVTQHREVQGQVKTMQVKSEGRHWYLVLSCDEVPMRLQAPTGRSVGIDVGIASFLTRSDGEQVANPRHARVAAERLAMAQRVLSTKQRGSNNRQRAKATVQNRHRKVANQRRDFHHKTALAIVREFDVIAVEDLKVKNMTRSATGTLERLGTNVAAKTRLNRSINDAGWAQFRSILEAKAEDAGRRVVSVNPRHTSQMCHQCGHIAKENRVTQEVFRCRACGHEDHADINAAKNILGAGLALLVADLAA
jgi:putative transposase